MIYQTLIHSFKIARKVRASWRHLLLENGLIRDVRRCNAVLLLKDVTNTCKRMWRSLSIGGSYSVQWWKVGRSWRFQMCFRRLFCVRIEIDQSQCVNCWVIIHCLSINYSRWALVISSSLQLTSKQWIITQQFTARADLFLAEWQQIISWSFHTAKYVQPWLGLSWHHVMLKAKLAWCLLASWLLRLDWRLVLCFGNTRIC